MQIKLLDNEKEYFTNKAGTYNFYACVVIILANYTTEKVL